MNAARPPVRIGMHASLWAPAWTREAAELAVPEAAAAGIELIEIPLLQPEAVDVAHTKAVLAQHGVAASASLCLPLDDRAGENPEGARRFLEGAVEVAAAIGCTFLGGVTYSALGYRSMQPPTEREYDNIARALKPIAKRCADHGMLLGIEPCNRYETHLLNTAAQGVAMRQRIGEPNVTIHLDTYHMNIEEKGFPTGFRIAGSDGCHYVHVSESDRGVPGTGTIDWEASMRTLAEIGFTGDLVLESFVTLPPDIAGALSVWRPVARDRHEVLRVGVPFIRSLARVHGLVP